MTTNEVGGTKPLLPAGWALAAIGDLTSGEGVFLDGDWVESKDQDPKGDVRLIQLADIGDGEFRDRSDRYLTSEKARELRCTFLETEDVLIARMPDPLGRACIFPGDSRRCVTVVDVCIVRTGRQHVSHRWLMHTVNSPQSRAMISSLQSGSTRRRISRGNLAKIQYPLPPLPEQHRIVDAIETQLTRLDAAVAALQRVKANLSRYKASVLAAACEGRLVPTEAELAHAEGRDYEPADVLLQRILSERHKKWEADQWQKEIARAQKKAVQAKRKAAGQPSSLREIPAEEWEGIAEEDYARYLPKNDKWKQKYKEPAAPDTEGLPEPPEGWAWTTVDQLGNTIGGLTKNAKRRAYPISMPYLRVANVYANELRLGDIAEIGVKPTEVERVLLQTGDLLVVEGNGSIDQIGRVAIWRGAVDPCVHQNHIIKVRLHHREFGEYILLWLLSKGGREQVTRVASSTSGLYTLSLAKVRMLSVPLAPPAEQQHIVAEVERRLSVIADIERTVDAGLNRAARLRQSILKRAFEGKLVPQDPSDEPASVLLERIRAGRG